MIVHVVPGAPAIRDTIVLWNTGRDGLECLSLGGFEARHDAVLSLLEQVERDHGCAPFGPLLVHTLDRPVSPVGAGWRAYTSCTADGFADTAVPDFVFGGWPQVGIDDFDETCRSVAAVGSRPAERPVVGWIGSLGTSPVRSVLHRLGQDRPDLLDVRGIDWTPGAAGPRLQTAAGNSLSLADQVGLWGALVDVEGKGYSGRVKLLLHSGRPLLLQDRPWREWYWDRLVPMEHYVPVRRDLSDLVERAEWVRDHPDEAARIGRAAQELARDLLTRSSAVEQWARTLDAASQAPRGRWAPPDLQDALDQAVERTRRLTA